MHDAGGFFSLSRVYKLLFTNFPSRRAPRRDRRGRRQLIVDGFERQIDNIADRFEDWELFVEDNGVEAKYTPPADQAQVGRAIYVVDMFCASQNLFLSVSN